MVSQLVFSFYVSLETIRKEAEYHLDPIFAFANYKNEFLSTLPFVQCVNDLVDDFLQTLQSCLNVNGIINDIITFTTLNANGAGASPINITLLFYRFTHLLETQLSTYLRDAIAVALLNSFIGD